jgi:hypothetical protein
VVDDTAPEATVYVGTGAHTVLRVVVAVHVGGVPEQLQGVGEVAHPGQIDRCTQGARGQVAVGSMHVPVPNPHCEQQFSPSGQGAN